MVRILGGQKSGAPGVLQAGPRTSESGQFAFTATCIHKAEFTIWHMPGSLKCMLLFSALRGLHKVTEVNQESVEILRLTWGPGYRDQR